jgi:hypothetical protein
MQPTAFLPHPEIGSKIIFEIRQELDFKIAIFRSGCWVGYPREKEELIGAPVGHSSRQAGIEYRNCPDRTHGSARAVGRLQNLVPPL